MERREIPAFLCLVMVGLAIFFIYAATVIGMNAREMIMTHRSFVSTVGDAGFTFIVENRYMVIAALVVLVIVWLLAHVPGASRS